MGLRVKAVGDIRERFPRATVQKSSLTGVGTGTT